MLCLSSLILVDLVLHYGCYLVWHSHERVMGPYDRWMETVLRVFINIVSHWFFGSSDSLQHCYSGNVSSKTEKFKMLTFCYVLVNVCLVLNLCEWM